MASRASRSKPVDYPRIGNEREHRVVWKRAHGPIPKGYDVHHKDEDKTNNDLTNLELLPKTEHGHLHGQQGGRPGLGVIKCADCGKKQKHFAKGRCKSCYLTWRSRQRYQGKMGRQIKCSECKRTRTHHSSGRCETCVKREQMRKRRRSGVIDSTTSRLKV